MCFRKVTSWSEQELNQSTLEAAPLGAGGNAGMQAAEVEAVQCAQNSTVLKSSPEMRVYSPQGLTLCRGCGRRSQG